jgi:hypothetical protein
MRLTYALIFYQKGVPVIPCYPGSKAILEGYGPRRDLAPDLNFLYNWIQKKNGNYALLTGDSGLVVLDFDSPEIYTDWFKQVGTLAETFTVATSRGYHVYYWADDLRSWKAEGVDILGRGKAVIGPYSRHPGGSIYKPLNQPFIRSLDTVADFPLLSDSRPVIEEPPEKAPKRSKRGDRGSDTIGRIKGMWGVLEALQAVQPKTYETLKGEGRWRRGLCPFHDDHKASFWVDTERDLFGCHACEARGDVINLVARTYGVKNSEAIKSIVSAGSLKIAGVKV